MIHLSPSDAAYTRDIPRELAYQTTRASSFPYAKKKTKAGYYREGERM